VTPAHRAPAAPASDTTASGAPSDAQIAAELREAYGSRAGSNIVDTATLTTADLATVPPGAPAKVAAMIEAGNQVARRPYVYGGGHGGGPEGLFIDSAYDCSGSVSFALAAAGFIKSPMDSTALSHFGRPGPGKWVTIYANAGHAWMTVAGLRFDTSGRSAHGSRWTPASRGTAGFVQRHPPGL
jgi:cell wall-associated NlpC family hydrolase